VTVHTIPLREGIQTLTYDQRATWGKCFTCGAEHGERCQSTYRPTGLFCVGHTPTSVTAHQERLDRAPARVRIEVLP
jgi:hypothetical protein